MGENKPNENIIQHLVVISRNKWLVLIGLIFLFVSVFIWLFLIKIDSILTCKGFISTSGTDYIIRNYDKGIITDITVKEGAYINIGDVIARIHPIDYSNDNEYVNVNSESIKANSIDIITNHCGFVSKIYVNKYDKLEVLNPIIKIAGEDKKNIDTVYVLIKDFDLEHIKVGMDAKIYINGLLDKTANHIDAIVTNINYATSDKELDEFSLIIGNDTSEPKKDEYLVKLKMKSELNGDNDVHSLKLSDATRFNYLLNKSCEVEFIINQGIPIKILLN